MAFPASATALGKVVQSGEGSNPETYTVPSTATGYHLGAGLTPPQPGTWVNVPDGAFPITPPAAPTTGTGTGFAGGGLTANGAYTWAISSVTDYGETPAGPQLVVPSVGSYTGYILNLPAVTEGTTDNPVRKRRLYRTVNGGAQLKYVCEIGDLNLTTWHDALPDLQLGDNGPTANTSGVTGTVTLSGGGVAVWTERSPTLAQGAMASGDFVVNRQTGNIIHATSDFARTGVTCNWSGATLDTAQLVRDHINAVRDIAAAAGAANGLATLNNNGALTATATAGALAVGGKLSVSSASGIAAGAAQSGVVPVPSGTALGTTYTVTTSACTAASLPLVCGSCGVTWNVYPVVGTVRNGSFDILIATRDAAAVVASGAIIWFIPN
jgi:hypothetical protein